jgi:hypothetical protein
MKPLLFALLLVYANNPLHQTEPIKPWDNGKVVVSENGRFLQHENGEPFFWLADTGWLLFRTLNRREADTYLENRRQLGFNVIQVMVVHEIPMLNFYGDSAFVKQNVAHPKVTPGQHPDDPEQYDFWDHVDYIIKTAEDKGLYVALVPVWGSNVRGGKVCQDAAAVYAAWLANRYKEAPNIFWLNGGDVRGSDKTDVWQILGRTIKKIDPNHLITFHPFGRTQSSTWFHNEAWLDFNMFQSGHRRYDQGDGEENWKGEDGWRYVKEDYAKTPVKPTLDGEPSYENIPQGLHDPSEPYWQAQDVRRYAYWSVFAGACGHTYGHNAVMQMYNPNSTKASYGVKEFWFDAINHPGAQQMQFVKKLLLSRPYFERLPDQSIVAGDAGFQYDVVIATRGQSYLFVYTYTGRDFKINMGRISGDHVRAWWYNPRDGEATEIGVFSNSGTLSFDPPGDKQEGNDWILVLDDMNLKFGAPGF